ncbi:hypothetical protein I7I50_04986 [Histoplasma capsulatum G186AR]|uniref:Uncharacterized protein n=1 Tax=Ajellomyces capsulatus TaxID=5037 RepID=A0A8H7ZBY2_AJECA|nr:hypothetical protein I7I52_03244 [Histoplasma capsulatum]QSS75743.1 hypothetical protein I7I50_04986 [Histoplasma capsulatum G186AR]
MAKNNFKPIRNLAWWFKTFIRMGRLGTLLGTFLPAAHHGFIGTMSNKNKIFILKRAKIFCNCHLTEGLTTHSNQNPPQAVTLTCPAERQQ